MRAQTDGSCVERHEMDGRSWDARGSPSAGSATGLARWGNGSRGPKARPPPTRRKFHRPRRDGRRQIGARYRIIMAGFNFAPAPPLGPSPLFVFFSLSLSTLSVLYFFLALPP